MRPAKTLISLRIRAVWSESSLIACAFSRLRDIQREINKKPCHTGWMYRLISVFSGHTDFIVGFVVRWLSYYSKYICWACATTDLFSLLFYVSRRYKHGFSSRNHTYIILTPLYSKTGVYRGIHYFSYSTQKHRLWVLVRTASTRRF